jgi:hypothetical protein
MKTEANTFIFGPRADEEATVCQKLPGGKEYQHQKGCYKISTDVGLAPALWLPATVQTSSLNLYMEKGMLLSIHQPTIVV